MYVKGKYIET